MEALQEKLKGNEELADRMSVDSLEHASVNPQSSWASLGDISVTPSSPTSPRFSPHPDYDDVDMGSSPSFHLLPPIEENSEPSTSSSSAPDPAHFLLPQDNRQLSASCHNIYANPRLGYAQLSVSNPQLGPLRNCAIYNTLYPLEPREIDPEAFAQLHTADSLEELQEFLLLESQCSTNEDGLAAAFLTSDKLSGTNAFVLFLSNHGW